MKRYLLILLTCLFVLVTGVVSATGADLNNYVLNNYVVGKLGVYTPTSNDLSGYDTGFNGEFAFGHYFNPYLALELGIGYFQTRGDVTVVDQNGFLFRADEKIEVTPFTLSLRAGIPINVWLEIYGIGGIGAYYVYDRIEVDHNHDHDHGHGHISDDKTEFGWHLGGGLNYNISRNFFVGAECKYVWLNATLFGQDVNLSGVRITGNFGFRF